MQILFTKTNSLLSKAIRWVTKDKETAWKDMPGHVAIRFGGKESNWMIQSNKKGVGPTWWPYFKIKNQIMFAYELRGIDEAKLELIIEDFIGTVMFKGYDYIAAVGLVFGQIKYKLFGKKQTSNKAGSNTRFFCSELAYRMLKLLEEKTDKDIIEDLDSELVSPIVLLKAMKKSKYFKKVRSI